MLGVVCSITCSKPLFRQKKFGGLVAARVGGTSTIDSSSSSSSSGGGIIFARDVLPFPAHLFYANASGLRRVSLVHFS